MTDQTAPEPNGIQILVTALGRSGCSTIGELTDYCREHDTTPAEIAGAA